jgi:hypothetical protein
MSYTKLRASYVSCILNDPIPYVLNAFQVMFPNVSIPTIHYGDLTRGHKGIYDPDKKLIVINSNNPISRVPEILTHELIHCAKGMPNHGPQFWKLNKKLYNKALQLWKKDQM